MELPKKIVSISWRITLMVIALVIALASQMAMAQTSDLRLTGLTISITPTDSINRLSTVPADPNDFDPATLEYSEILGADVQSLVLDVAALDVSSATITLSSSGVDRSLDSHSAANPTTYNPVAITVPLSDIDYAVITVALSDGSADKSYTIDVTRITWCANTDFDPRIEFSAAYADADDVPQAIDIDKDDDGLIEICDLEGLHAMRYVVDGSGYRGSAEAVKITAGCKGSGCNGYELVRHLDFLDEASYRSTTNKVLYTEGAGWQGIGRNNPGDRFTATFNGNRYTISNLRSNTHSGLFDLVRDAKIENVGLVNIETNPVTSGGIAGGGLVRRVEGTTAIINNYVVGGSINSSGSRVGGLIGFMESFDDVRIDGNYTRIETQSRWTCGGLIGDLRGGSVSNNYASGTVRGGFGRNFGGLIGDTNNTFTKNISNNYATAVVTGMAHAFNVGGFVGAVNNNAELEFRNNYWDAERSGLNHSAGERVANTAATFITVSSRTTVGMVAPTAPGSTSTDSYFEWSTDYWDFGTNRQYPALKYITGNEALGHKVGDLLAYQRFGLINLTLRSGDQPLAINFLSGQLDYHLSVAAEVDEITLIATTDTGATMTINGTPTASDEPRSFALASAKTTTITIVVTTVRGTATETHTYTLSLFRSRAVTLRTLAVSPGTLQPSFDKDISEYTLFLDNAIESFAITEAAAEDPEATVTLYTFSISPNNRVTLNEHIGLAAGQTRKILIQVVAPEGDHKTYTIDATRAWNADANLATNGLLLDSGTLQPAFDPEVVDYEVDITGLERVTITVRTAHSDASVVLRSDDSQLSALSSRRYQINLPPEGVTTVEIIVTAQDAETTKTYTVKIRSKIGTEATLSALRLIDSNIHSGNPIPLNRETDTRYTADVVASTQSWLSFTASPGATARVTVGNQVVANHPLFGTRYYLIRLTLGSSTVVQIRVSSADGESETDYTLVINHTIGTDARVHRLTFEAPVRFTQLPLTPTFDPDLFEYRAIATRQSQYLMFVRPSTAATVVEVMVNSAPADQLARYGNTYYVVNLEVGQITQLQLVVLAQDGETQAAYTIAIEHRLDTNADLDKLRLIDNFDEAIRLDFTSQTISYSTSVTAASFVTVQASVSAMEYRLDRGRVPAATFTVNTKAVADDTFSDPITLNLEADTTIEILVTAQDGTTMKRYSVVISQVAGAEADLAALRLSNQQDSPLDLSADEIEAAETFTIVSLLGATHITVTPQASRSATVKVDDFTVASGASSPLIELRPGANTTITISVIAQDRETMKTYTLVVHSLINKEAVLEELNLDRAQLVPSFSTATTSYETSSTSAVLDIVFRASPGATIGLTDIAGDMRQLTEFGDSGSYRVDITRTTTTIIIFEVRAQDGTDTRTYTLAATRTVSGLRIRTKLFLESPLPR